jgi:hypothetical protein
MRVTTRELGASADTVEFFPKLYKRMNLPALKGGVSCKRYIVYEVRSVRKLFNCGACYYFSLALSIEILRMWGNKSLAPRQPPQGAGVLNYKGLRPKSKTTGYAGGLRKPLKGGDPLANLFPCIF